MAYSFSLKCHVLFNGIMSINILRIEQRERERDREKNATNRTPYSYILYTTILHIVYDKNLFNKHIMRSNRTANALNE